MTEDDAQRWIAARWPDAIADLSLLAQLVIAESHRQNLIARSTVTTIWRRHLLDSVQLAALAPVSMKPWIDIGTGGGFPGLACALVRPEPFVLVEPRRRRAAFLHEAVQALDLADRVSVLAQPIEKVVGVAGTVSARAVASITDLLGKAAPVINRGTACVFPRGAIDEDDVAQARRTWNMTFHVERSISDPASSIAIISGVEPASCGSR